MRLLYPTAATRQWFERNAVPALAGYDQTAVAPHGATTRLTITPPANQWLHITHVRVACWRDGTATATGVAICALQIRQGANVSQAVMARFMSGTISSGANIITPLDIWLDPTMDALVVTSDTSGDGTIWYTAAVQYVTFDQ